MNLAEKYNKIYSDNKVTFGRGKPEKVVKDILKYKKSGTVLELGAGEGRNSIFLAKQGFNVRAIDISNEGINKIKTFVKDKIFQIQTEVMDITSIRFENNHDVFISTFVFHHLSSSDALNLIDNIQKHTNLGGLNVVVVFMKNGAFYKADPLTKNFFPQLNQLRTLYKEWEILEYEERESEAFQKNLDGSAVFNMVATILARKNL